MSTLLIVHGGMHGPWCWDRVAPELVNAGHDVLTVMLPGRDGTPLRGDHSPFLSAVDELVDRLLLEAAR